MTVKEFFDKYNGQFVEVAGSVGAENQCVDLANAYIRDVLKLPIIEWTNAKDFPSKASKDDYDWIPNTPEGVPELGDIIIWGGNQYGHIAIVRTAGTMQFESFDQNYPTGSPCHFVEHSYKNVIGWLRPKKVEVNTMTLTKDEQTDINNWKAVCQMFNISDPKQLRGKIDEYEEKIKTLNNKVEEGNRIIDSKNDKVASLESDLVKIKGSSEAIEEQLRTELKVAQEAKDKCVNELATADRTIKELRNKQTPSQTAIDELDKKLDTCVKKNEILKNRPTLQTATVSELISSLFGKFKK